MASIFTSMNQPSLFPLAVPTPMIPKQDYYLFYKNERLFFKFMCVLMNLELIQSTLVVAFLIWLEREGFTSFSLVEMIVHHFALDFSNQAVNQVLTCIRLLYTRKNNIRCEGTSGYEISLLQHIVDCKEIHLEELYHNGEMIFSEVSEIGRDIFEKAFDDLLVRNIWDDEVAMMQPRRDMTIARFASTLGFNQDAEYVPELAMAHFYGQMQQMQVAAALASGTIGPNLVPQLGQTSNHVYVGDHVVPIVKEPEEEEKEEEVPPEDRTIFLTFSKGYPIPMREVVEFFKRMFGDFVESTHMQEVDGDEQPLYARIVARQSSMMKAVVERDGPSGKSKYNINGKHVWARKFVPRTSSKDSSEA